MKIRDIANHMNNYGTKPRIMVMKHFDGYSELIYEGSPRNADAAIADMKVISFTVKGVGFLEIHV